MSASTIRQGWLRPAPPQRLEPGDRFVGLDVPVVDFWRWAFSDLRENTVRGVLAEFLVAAAVGSTATRRKGWDNFDVLTPSGVRVEVKASAYLQSWPQAALSKPRFGRVAARSWDENTNEFGSGPEVRADVFVFAVHTCCDPDAYDTLALAQWEFYVVSAEEVRASGYKGVSLTWVTKRAKPLSLGEVGQAIERCASASPVVRGAPRG